LDFIVKKEGYIMARIPVEAIIPNTRMEAYYNANNVLRVYYIYPLEGYGLHHNAYDEPILDEEGNPTGEVIQRFTTAFLTVPYNYDFEANPENIFTKPLSELDENQLCGGTTEPDHEVM
jgi:hypothetical protein